MLKQKFDWADAVINVIVVCILWSIAGYGSGATNDPSDVYKICRRLPYADDYTIDLLIRTTREAKDLGASDMVILSTMANSCDNSCVEPICSPPICDECMLAIVDLVYWEW
ncbi:MAG TPA: hypothetical protein VJB69_02660 [Candidatus Paceibacterota bacterium]